jgi:hypothetical protein
MAVSPQDVEDVVFYGDSATGTWSELAIDDSGEDTNLTAGMTYAYESSSARANLTTRRTVDIVIEHDDTVASGTLWSWNRSSEIDRINLNSGDTITVFVDGSSIITHSIANVSATTEEFVISWAMEPNPDTIDSTDAMRSELHVYNVDQSTYETSVATHAAPTAGVGDVVFGAQDTSGTGDYDGTITAIRLSSGFHSSTEMYETFVSQSSAPTLVGKALAPMPMPERSQVALGDDGHFAGPIHIMATAAAQNQRALLWSPVVNDYNRDGDIVNTNVADGYNVSYSMTNGALVRLGHAYYRPLPVGCTHVIPRVHIQVDHGTSAPDTVLSVYSMSQPGPISRPNTSPNQYEEYYVSAVKADDGNTTLGGGDWVTLGKLKIAYDNTLGASYFAVGTNIPDGVGSDYRISAVTLTPVFVEAGDGLGFGGFG